MPENMPRPDQSQKSPESLEGLSDVSKLLMSALRSIGHTGKATITKIIIEKIEQGDPGELSAREKEILDDLDWWVQICESGDKERARKYYQEKLKPSQTELEEKSAATN